MSAHTDLLTRIRSHDDVQLATLAHVEQRRADDMQRQAAEHQRTADAARKELRRRRHG